MDEDNIVKLQYVGGGRYIINRGPQYHFFQTGSKNPPQWSLEKYLEIQFFSKYDFALGLYENLVTETVFKL